MKTLLRMSMLLAALSASPALARRKSPPPAPAPSAAPSPITFEPLGIPPGKSVFELLPGKVKIYGVEYPAISVCTEDAITNPDQIHFYKLNDPQYSLAVHCAAELDGGINVVTVAGRGEHPRASKVSPENAGTCCLTPEQVHQEVLRLLKRKPTHSGS